MGDEYLWSFSVAVFLLLGVVGSVFTAGSVAGLIIGTLL